MYKFFWFGIWGDSLQLGSFGTSYTVKWCRIDSNIGGSPKKQGKIQPLVINKPFP